MKPCLASALVILSLVAAVPAVAQDFAPIPQTENADRDKAALGEKLFNDKLLSSDGTVSCATCHDLSKGGVDRLRVSTGIKGQKGGVNAPTVYNSAHNLAQFWDGRAKNLQAQAEGPVVNPVEMGDTWEDVVKKVAANPAYVEQIKKLYGGPATKENVTDAIAEFEKTLSTPNSRFDRYLRGKKDALNAEEIKGFTLFKTVGCGTCHSGTYFGGESYQTLNADYFKDRGGKESSGDLGRYNVTRKEADKHAFKVPMLRNVAVTKPYFHDGTAETLEEAVRRMAHYQLGNDLPDADVKAIAAFLGTLTGEYKGVPLDKMQQGK